MGSNRDEDIELMFQYMQQGSSAGTKTSDGDEELQTRATAYVQPDEVTRLFRSEKMWLGEISDMEDDLDRVMEGAENFTGTDRKDAGNMLAYLVKESFYTYFRLSFDALDPLIRGKHVRLICNLLTRAERGEFRGPSGFTKIILTVPPRHLKSRIVSESFPSWFMAKKPTRHVIAVSYSADLGVKFGEKNREKFCTLGKKYFNVDINPNVRGKSPWETSKGARFLGAGVGGALTGFGADLLIIDDPFKNRKEADSAVTRETVWSEWEDTIKTRLHNNGIVIVIHTRWHDDDLIGRLLKQNDAHEWIQFNLPAECENENSDLLERKLGEPLWPECGFDNKFFDAFRNQPRTWAALYQQRPTLAGSSTFKSSDFRYFDILHDRKLVILYTPTGEKAYRFDQLWSFQSIDTALKEKEESDFTAMADVIVTPDYDILIRDMFLEKLSVPKQPQAVASFRAKWEPSFQLMEEKQSGIFLTQFFDKTSTPLRPINVHKDKITRCFEILTFYERGKVYHYRKMPKLDDMEGQLLRFPYADHDDAVDAISQAGTYITKHLSERGLWDSGMN